MYAVRKLLCLCACVRACVRACVLVVLCYMAHPERRSSVIDEADGPKEVDTDKANPKDGTRSRVFRKGTVKNFFHNSCDS